jgi:F0F1-type ATP synthase epsilon subunit
MISHASQIPTNLANKRRELMIGGGVLHVVGNGISIIAYIIAAATSLSSLVRTYFKLRTYLRVETHSSLAIRPLLAPNAPDTEPCGRRNTRN